MRSLLMMLALLAVEPLVAADVYRWTDSQGQVHFGQRPPPEGAARVELPRTGGAATDPGDAQRRQRQQRLLDDFEYQRARRKADEASAAEARRVAGQHCAELQRSWRRLSHPGPIYVQQEDGSRRYLDEAQRTAQKARLLPVYRKVCGEAPS